MGRPLRPESVGGSHYREHPPARALAGVVACTWEGTGGWERRLRVLPDGCVDLVYDGLGLSVAAARPRATRLSVGARDVNAGLRLRPGAAGAVLGIAACELPESAPLWGAAELARVRAAPSPRIALEQLVAERAGTLDRVVLDAVACLAATRVDAVAAGVAVSTRELRRRFDVHVGYGPKRLQRVLRFGRFTRELGALAAGRTTLARVAADAGYADQAHLTRECGRLSGSTPHALVASWAETSKS